MGSFNKVILCGHLGRDAELRYTKGGSAVATLSLATSESWSDRDSGERKERTEWHRIVLWGKSAESLQPYLTKGKQIIVDGQLTTREWEDKDGNKRYTTEVKAQRVTLLGGGKREAGDDQRRDDVEAADTGSQAAAPASDDDIPFAFLLPLLASQLLWNWI